MVEDVKFLVFCNLVLMILFSIFYFIFFYSKDDFGFLCVSFLGLRKDFYKVR